jgi:hypothetical protein
MYRAPTVLSDWVYKTRVQGFSGYSLGPALPTLSENVSSVTKTRQLGAYQIPTDKRQR